MKISGITLLEPKNGIKNFPSCKLGDIVILAGSNGSGKTRLIKLIINHIHNLANNLKKEENISMRINDDENYLTVDLAKKIKIVNYSHYDARLQVPKNFPPYVIHKAKENLINCNYEETALNSLLWIYDIACEYSNQEDGNISFEDFSSFVKEKFGLELSVNRDKKPVEVKLFKEDINHTNLSPGQLYLLRMAVACQLYQNDEDMIVFLDEPELHLHPEALINVVEHLIKTFEKSQFWISTHSLSLIAYLAATKDNTTILNLVDGEPKVLRSDSDKLIKGLMGTDDNRRMAQEFLSTPYEYACNKFAVECYSKPDTLSANPNDPQNEMIECILKNGDTIVDYGTGKGRFIEGLGMDIPEIIDKIHFFAYDPEIKDSEKCKSVMKKLGISCKNYTTDINALIDIVNQGADYVLLVNVLHEISPQYWSEVFKNIHFLLKENGKLIIVEREELTVGEMPYNDGFLVMVESAALKLFGKENVECTRYEKKDKISGETIVKPIVKYTIDKKGITNIDGEKIKLCIKEIESESLKNIKSLREDNKEKGQEYSYKAGLKTAFWLHQYANSSLILKNVL